MLNQSRSMSRQSRPSGSAARGSPSDSVSRVALQRFRLAMNPVELDFLAAYLSLELEQGMSEQEAQRLYDQARSESPNRAEVPPFQEVLSLAHQALSQSPPNPPSQSESPESLMRSAEEL